MPNLLTLSLVSHLDDIEPVKGLPERLPPGEEIIWQGSPNWQAIAIRVFHARKMAIYFAFLFVLRFGEGLALNMPVLEALRSASPAILLSIAPVGFLAGLGWLTSWASVYTITNRRVFLRIGVLFSVNVNVPFKIIESADLRLFRGGNGDIPLKLAGKERISYITLWPHVRPWRFKPAQPMLRGLSNVREVADILAKTIQDAEKAEPESADILKKGDVGAAAAGAASQ